MNDLTMTCFTLDKNNNACECNLEEWANLYRTGRRRVGSDYVNDYHISTVFLGIEHGYDFAGNPLLFETMIFGAGELDGYQTRCSTWDEAVEMHKEAIEKVSRISK